MPLPFIIVKGQPKALLIEKIEEEPKAKSPQEVFGNMGRVPEG